MPDPCDELLRGQGSEPGDLCLVRPFALAGVWRAYKANCGGGEAREMIIVSMVTLKPNAMVMETHSDRGPVILNFRGSCAVANGHVSRGLCQTHAVPDGTHGNPSEF